MKTYFGRRNRTGTGRNLVMVSVAGATSRMIGIKESQKVFNHSEDYDWGYGGSGPSQTALAILLDYLPKPEEALKLHQDFKWHFVSGWDDNWQITGKEIDAWILETKQGGKGFTGSPKAPIGTMPTAHIPPKSIQGAVLLRLLAVIASFGGVVLGLILWVVIGANIKTMSMFALETALMAVGLFALVIAIIAVDHRVEKGHW
jgi:hypothetical protein